MGSSNRDYMQDNDGSQGPTWGHDVPTTKWLLIVTVVVFALQTILVHSDRGIPQFERPPVVTSTEINSRNMDDLVVTPVALQGGGGNIPRSYVEDWCLLDASKVLRGQIWRLVTYAFCHHRLNPFGIVFNMIAVWYLGSSLERMYGSREILWFYLASAFVCGIIFTAFGLKFFLPIPLMGAGGCVMALLTLYATHFPRREILFFWVVPVEIRVLLGIYVALDIYTILQAYGGIVGFETVAYMSDLWGVVFGYLYRRYDVHLTGLVEAFDLSRMQRSFRRARASRNLKVYAPEPVSNLDEQVDAILAKIHEQGSESLTDRERSILQKASEQAKNRL